MASPPALPRDLDVTPLKRQVVHHTTSDGSRLAYFPLAVLVFVTEVGGVSKGAARLQAAQEAAEMLRYRSVQLSIAPEHLLRASSDAWAEPPTVPMSEGDYITHRGFLEVLAFWMSQRGLGAAAAPAAVKPEPDAFPRLKRYAEYQAAIGEILFGVVMPAAPAASLPSPHTLMQSAAATPASTVAHLTPVLPTGPVKLSTPPNGTKTIQDEIEESESAATNGDAPTAAASSSSSAASFAILSDGLLVHLTRHDGRELPALTGRLLRLLPDLTLSSAMPAHRSSQQPISALKTLTGESATIEEYWAARFFTYTDPALKDPSSPRRVRIAEVQLDDGAPFIYPTDKMWRVTAAAADAAEIAPNPAIKGVARAAADQSGLFFPPPVAPVAPQLSHLAQLWLGVSTDPWHLPTWQQLLTEVSLTHDLPTIRHAYHAFLKVFPTSAAHWRTLIELELNHRAYDEIERILPVAIRTMPEIELWKMYLVYQKVVHSPPPGVVATEEQTREMNIAIETAYEFVLDHMGLDLHSGQVWKSYINFVRGIPARSQAEEAGKTASLRKLYQRVVCVPIQPKELSHFWDEYQAFERGVAQQMQSKTTMTKMIADYQNRFATTHKESQERRRKYAGILSASIGNSYGASNAITQSSVHVANRASPSQLQQAKDALQLQHWIRYLRFESRKLEWQDMTVYKQRVVLAYRQCLLYCRHFPNIWHDYLHFLQTPKLYFPPEQIRLAWKEFKEAMPYSILPTLIHADVEEEAKHIVEAKELYESLLQQKKTDEPLDEAHCFTLPENVREEHRKLRAFEQEVAAKEEAANAAAAPPAAAAANATAAPVKEEPKEETKENTDNDGVIDIYQGELHKIHPLVFILLMRFIRRTEGVEVSRRVFLLARRSPFVTFHSWLYAAYAEHHIHNDLAKAQAIYAAGMKMYGDRMEAYLLQYLHFLKETNDHNNLRLIFGRILLTESAESAEQSQHLSRKESAQMRKAQQMTAAAAKDSANAAAAALAAKENAYTNEAANDESISPDDWWASVNGLFEPTAIVNAPPPPSTTTHGFHNRANRTEDRLAVPSGPLPSSTLLSLWSSYVSFERDTANELSVLVKAEEKRDAKLTVRYSHKIVHWIDRWRFMDLWPCSPQMRQTIEKAIQPGSVRLADLVAAETTAEAERAHAALGVIAPTVAASATTAPRQRGVLITDASVVSNLKASVSRPDLTRLSSFAASSQQFDRASMRTRYGAATPVPEQLLNVLSVLPPSHLFQGPFIHPNLVLDMLQHVVPEEKTMPVAPSTSGAHTDPARADGPKKRKHRGDVDDDEEEVNLDVNTPSTDLYRKRQQQKMAKQAE